VRPSVAEANLATTTHVKYYEQKYLRLEQRVSGVLHLLTRNQDIRMIVSERGLYEKVGVVIFFPSAVGVEQ